MNDNLGDFSEDALSPIVVGLTLSLKLDIDLLISVHSRVKKSQALIAQFFEASISWLLPHQ